jgi:hypothetical protein
MSKESRVLAGILLIPFPTVLIGGASLLSLRVFTEDYARNPLHQDLWRAGHAHAGVFLVLALAVLRYVDGSALSSGWKWLVRLSAPIAAILLPAAFFLSVLSPAATEPNALIYLAYVGAVILALGLFILGIGLVRQPQSETGTPERNRWRAVSTTGVHSHETHLHRFPHGQWQMARQAHRIVHGPGGSDGPDQGRGPNQDA